MSLITSGKRALSRRGFTLVEIMVSMVILALLAAGFFSVITSGRYLVSRSKRRLAAYEIARRQIEARRAFVRADTWYAGGTDPLNPTGGLWTTWGCSTVVGNITYQTRVRIDTLTAAEGCAAAAAADCPRRLTVQVRWNETKL